MLLKVTSIGPSGGSGVKLLQSHKICIVREVRVVLTMTTIVP